MRIAAVLLLSSLTLNALEKEEVVGLWKMVFPEEWNDHADYVEPKIEIWFGPDGTQESRAMTVMGETYSSSTIQWEWQIENGKLLERRVSGWSHSYPQGYTALGPDTGFTRYQVVQMSPYPKFMVLKACETCNTQKYRFVSASRNFSLRDVTPGAAVRKAAPGRQTHRNPGSFYRFGVEHWGRSYDLKGRLNPTPLR